MIRETGPPPRASLAGRYATALLDLAVEHDAAERVEDDLIRLTALIRDNPDLQRLLNTPTHGRAQRWRALKAVLQHVRMGPLTLNFAGLAAQNGRLAHLPAMISATRALMAQRRGETIIYVTTASPLDEEQTRTLTHIAQNAAGPGARIHARVDPSLLGGMIVQWGSKRIDTSLKTRLNSLARAMKTPAPPKDTAA